MGVEDPEQPGRPDQGGIRSVIVRGEVAPERSQGDLVADDYEVRLVAVHARIVFLLLAGDHLSRPHAASMSVATFRVVDPEAEPPAP
jgi:hypothetical protein